MKKVLAASVSFCKFSMKNEPGERLRKAGFQVDVNSTGKVMTESELLDCIAEYDAIIAGMEPMTSEVIRQGKNLKIIARNGVGFDNVDLKAATAFGIFVTITPGAVEQAVADSTIGLMLAVARNIVRGDAELRKGEWPKLVGTNICGKKLGVVGLGRVGKNVIMRSSGFNMEAYAFDPQPDLEFCEKYHVKVVDLDTLLQTCAFVSIHAPLLESTRHLINKDRLALMRPEAVLINTSRGGLLDEIALIDALQEKRIAGAALDVFENEPLRQDSRLLTLENVVLNPHLAGMSSDALLASGKMIVDNLITTFAGGIPAHIANKEVLAKKQ